MTRAITIIAILVSFLVPRMSLAENPNDIMIVANLKVSQDTLNETEIRALFLKKRLSWRNGDKAIAINAREGSRLRAEFEKRILQMSSRELDRYWQRLKILQGDTPPPGVFQYLEGGVQVKRLVELYLSVSVQKRGRQGSACMAGTISWLLVT